MIVVLIVRAWSACGSQPNSIPHFYILTYSRLPHGTNYDDVSAHTSVMWIHFYETATAKVIPPWRLP